MTSPSPHPQAHCDLAAKHGAKIVSGERVVSWRPLGGGSSGGGSGSSSSSDDAGVEVTTASGSRYTAGRLIITAGAWMEQLVPETKGLCVPVRQVVAWFDCPKDKFKKERFPGAAEAVEREDSVGF